MLPVLLLRRNASAPFGAAFPSVGAPSLTVRRLKERSAAFMRQGKEGERAEPETGQRVGTRQSDSIMIGQRQGKRYGTAGAAEQG